MKTRKFFGALIVMFVLSFTVNISGQSELHKYFSDAANKVKATENAAEKRQILSKTFQKMSSALDKVESSGLVSEGDRAGLDKFRAKLQDKQDELTGRNGFERVADSQLNNFSNYVVQDIEQAQMLTISIVTLLLIIILLVLIL